MDHSRFESVGSGESRAAHPPYFLEQELARAVSAGDSENAHRVLAEHRAFQPPRLAQDDLRSMKNVLICMFAVVARAAIAGGVLPEAALALSDKYIYELDERTSMAEISGMSDEVLAEFLTLVQAVKARQFSAPVSETIQHINMHLTDKLTLPQLAQRVHLHPNYLSSVFKKETGESITSFILRSRIREAAAMLRNTQHSASEIARIFNFCNQSYFIKMFRRYMDCSPQQYRESAEV